VYKIAIAGASSLLGKELKEALEDSPLMAADLVLLDEEQVQGQLDRVGDEVTFVKAINEEAFDHVDFTFFAGSEDLTRTGGFFGTRSVRRFGSGGRRSGAHSMGWSFGGGPRSVYSGRGAGSSGGVGAGADCGKIAGGGSVAGGLCHAFCAGQ
jgi:hypothetical protein